ncbi:hypothetical protein TELCIR_22033 [Teladorsagia circumcincta]|uniref:Peptidase M20 dimerisation domain-containing protein n=1 Tax=Teladorsagia circumcincta TaxID=45464 RepID=A0A2G9TF34_TELCI|nr:hypothetical protein TELCIR_22033 [Teladorsagia circumcincta]
MAFKIFLSQRSTNRNVTNTNTNDPYWRAFASALAEEGCEYRKEIFTAGTDSRFVRKLGYRAIGFSPMTNTKVLLHDHDECIHEKVFLRGIQIYATIIDNLGNLPAE